MIGVAEITSMALLKSCCEMSYTQKRLPCTFFSTARKHTLGNNIQVRTNRITCTHTNPLNIHVQWIVCFQSLQKPSSQQINQQLMHPANLSRHSCDWLATFTVTIALAAPFHILSVNRNLQKLWQANLLKQKAKRIVWHTGNTIIKTWTLLQCMLSETLLIIIPLSMPFWWQELINLLSSFPERECLFPAEFVLWACSRMDKDASKQPTGAHE